MPNTVKARHSAPPAADDRPAPRKSRGATRDTSRGTTRRFHARRWPLRVMAIVFVLALGSLLWWAQQRGNQPTYQSLPAPSIGANGANNAAGGIQSAAGSKSAAQTAAESAAGSASASGSAPSTAAVQTISQSPAVQIYIPNDDAKLTISTTVAPLSGCRKVIDPPHSGKGFGGVFGCSDFAQPGTDSPSLSVVAGHSAKGVKTAFNKLYVQGDSLVGKEVFLRTQASGDKWLAYTFTAVYSPDKADLPYLTKVWGGDGSSTADRLVVVTCRQDPQTPTATHNYVAVAQFEGVR